jgi:hypothetical protein
LRRKISQKKYNKLSPEKKKNYRMARLGPKNGRWRGGKSKTYYRRIAKCKTNDGYVVHHLLRGEKTRNKIFKIPHTRDKVIRVKGHGNHNKHHPEKGGYHK